MLLKFWNGQIILAAFEAWNINLQELDIDSNYVLLCYFCNLSLFAFFSPWNAKAIGKSSESVDS